MPRRRLAARALLTLVAFYAAVFGGAVVLRVVTPAHVGALWPAPLNLVTVYVLVVALAVNVVCTVRGWRSARWLGWPGVSRGFHGLGFGLAVGLGMAATVVLLGVVSGSASVTLSTDQAAGYIPAAAGIAGGLAISALAEELLFRGLPLAQLADWLGRGRASIIVAGLFAVAHIPNPGVSVLGLANIGLAALVLSAAFFGPGGLPAAWGLHLGWNAGFSLGADAPVSGISFHLPALEYTATAADWWIGGRFGPEEGLAATLVMAGAALWLARRNARGEEAGSA